MDNKTQYRQFCQSEQSIPLFSQPWWLDSVCGDRWDVCLVFEDQQIIASMPYLAVRKLGFTFIIQPPITQALGPWIKPQKGKSCSQLARQKKLMFALIEQLPAFAYFKQSWHYSQRNWLPFYWQNFQQTTRYTYVIDNLSNLNEVWHNFHTNYRNKIKKAEKIVSIKEDYDPSDFYDLHCQVFARQNTHTSFSKPFFMKHHNAIQTHHAGKIFYAQDAAGRVHSALYLIWDKQSAYVHIIGEDPQLRSSGAGILLIWHTIQYSKTNRALNCYDFEGSVIESIEAVRRNCGGIQKPFSSIYKINSPLVKLFYLSQSLFKP